MNVDVAANKRFLDTATQQSSADWDELLVSQVDLSIASELNILLRIDKWNRASRVIDAGCGNGYYLAKLQQFFPGKAFVGIDISAELTGSAAVRHPGVEFHTADFFSASVASADVLIMRFLVQHLGDFTAILRQAQRMLRPRGALIIIESDLSRSTMRPLPPTFFDMLTIYHQVSAAEGGLKVSLLGDIEGLIGSTGENWRLLEEANAATALVGPFADGKLLRVFRKWVDLAERSEMFAFGFEEVRSELVDWAAEPASFVNFVTRMFVLERIAGDEPSATGFRGRLSGRVFR